MATDREINTMWRGRQVAPPDERRDMTRQLTQTFFDPAEARRLAQYLPQGMAEGQEFFSQIQKAIRPANRQHTLSIDASGGGRKSLFQDPNRVWIDVAGVRPRRGQLQPNVLRQMRRDDPIIVAILQNLKNRAQAFAKPVPRGLATLLGGAEGFDFRPRFKPDHEPLTPAEERTRQKFVDFLLNGGDVGRFTNDGSDNREDLERETLAQNISLIIDQRYTFDGVPIELERTRDGRSLSGFYVLPGDTIHRVDRAAWERLQYGYARENPNARFAQVISEQVYTTYGSNDLFYDYVNAQDGLGMRGYGMGEIEMCARLTIGILNILTNTSALFDRNAIPPSIAILRGQVNEAALDEFTEAWNAYGLGAGGNYMLPMLSFRDPTAGMDIKPVAEQPRDMAFSNALSFYGAIDCSIFGIDASEINLSAFGGNNSNLSSGKDTETKLTDSRNRAFMPMMMRLEALFATVLGPLIGDDWEFKFIGLAKQETGALQELINKATTVNEVRTGVLGMQPLTEEQGGDSLLDNPAISQMKIAAAKQEAQPKSKPGGAGKKGKPASSKD